jgi:S1-C subfamily serine protease
VSAGVVARVVKAGSSPFFMGLESRKEGKSSKPAMLQTTAAVHPGGSGGAVVNGEGRLIGLVTRYEPQDFNSRI